MFSTKTKPRKWQELPWNNIKDGETSATADWPLSYYHWSPSPQLSWLTVLTQFVSNSFGTNGLTTWLFAETDFFLLV